MIDLKTPANLKELGRLKSLFAYYAKWVKNVSEKVALLNNSPSFPKSKKCTEATAILKQDVLKAVRASVDYDVPFTVETDASDSAIGAQPVEFFSTTLTASVKT